MIELYLSKVTETSETETAGKMYARVSYKQTMDRQDQGGDCCCQGGERRNHECW